MTKNVHNDAIANLVTSLNVLKSKLHIENIAIAQINSAKSVAKIATCIMYFFICRIVLECIPRFLLPQTILPALAYRRIFPPVRSRVETLSRVGLF